MNISWRTAGTCIQTHVYQQAWPQNVTCPHSVRHTHLHIHFPLKRKISVRVRQTHHENTSHQRWQHPRNIQVSISPRLAAINAPHTCMQHLHVHLSLNPTVRRVTRLPAAFNWNSPRDCGSCRQPLRSASSLVTHMQRCSSPVSQMEGENKKRTERRRETGTEAPSGEPKTRQRHKRCAERKMPSRRVNNNTGGWGDRRETSNWGCALLSLSLFLPRSLFLLAVLLSTRYTCSQERERRGRNWFSDKRERARMKTTEGVRKKKSSSPKQ